jgi:hypothetical protein
MSIGNLFGPRGDLLTDINALVLAAVLDSSITTRDAQQIGTAANIMLSGWKALVVATSSSNPGYEIQDLSLETLLILKQTEHLIGILTRSAKVG